MPSRRQLADRERFRSLLKQIRLDTGLTQADLADRLGQPQSFVSKFESGERRIDVLELRQICVAMGIGLVDFVRLFEGEDG